MNDLSASELILMLLIWIAALYLIVLNTGCSTQELTKTQYAYQHIYGHDVLCARAVAESCGMTLSDCSDGFIYRCTSDVIIVNIDRGTSLPGSSSGL